MRLVLFGFKGVGKSTLGRRLAEIIQSPFFDTDLLIEELYSSERREKLSCREIMLKRGEGFFRKLERQAVERLETVHEGVVALGGGALLNQENRKFVENWGVLVYLVASREFLRKRLLSTPLPAFLDSKDPEGSFEKMYLERSVIFEQLSAHKICVEGKEEMEIVWEAIRLVPSFK